VLPYNSQEVGTDAKGEPMEDDSKLHRIISRGAELTGAGAGGLIGFFAGGPVGAAIGGAAGPAIAWSLQKVGKDIAERWLSPWEEARIGAGLFYVRDKMRWYLEGGHQIRDDDFFDQGMHDRSKSDEILEGVLLKCKQENEEKKLKLISNIYINTAFMPNVSVAGANWLLQKVQEFTYRQLCILSLIERIDVPFSRGPSYGPNDGDPAFEVEYRQLDDMLARKETLQEYYRGHRDEVGEATPVIGLSRIGKFCYTVMSLDEISADDLRILAARFPRAFTKSD
jgi:hypothetical protein